MSDDSVWIRPWTEADLAVELRNNSPEMTAFLGGPLDEGIVRDRHERFLSGQADGTGAQFTLWTGEEQEPVGTVGYWQTEHDGFGVSECGWFVFASFQGRGFARRGVKLLLDHAATHGDRDRDRMYAFPRTDNGASNALARSAGFTNTGVEDFEYPKGVSIKVNAWVFDLRTLR
jgi:RimJ/RimL family protein N-acetyltransferase